MEAIAGPSAQQIERWLKEIDGELDALQLQMEPLVLAQSRLHDRRVLLKELLGSLGDVGAHPAAMARGNETTRERVHREAVEVLRDVGQPMHSNDIHAEFLKRGIQIPGAGKPNNITVHLTGWADVTSPERGMYALTEHVGTAVAAKSRKPAQRRKKRVRR